jgi:hypothetical protein
MKVGKQIKIVSYYPPDQVAALTKLSDATRVPKAEYLREALDDLLKKYLSSVRDSARPRQRKK